MVLSTEPRHYPPLPHPTSALLIPPRNHACQVFGAYYLGAARGDVTGQGATGFYEATVYGRIVSLDFMA